jgi:chromosome segregation ATPase
MPLGTAFDCVAVSDLIEAQQAEIERLLALLGHAAKNLTAREVENDEMNEDIIRLLTEVGQLRAHVERLRALANDLHHDATCTESFCRLCGEGVREWEARREG